MTASEWTDRRGRARVRLAGVGRWIVGPKIHAIYLTDVSHTGFGAIDPSGALPERASALVELPETIGMVGTVCLRAQTVWHRRIDPHTVAFGARFEQIDNHALIRLDRLLAAIQSTS